MPKHSFYRYLQHYIHILFALHKWTEEVYVVQWPKLNFRFHFIVRPSQIVLFFFIFFKLEVITLNSVRRSIISNSLFKLLSLNLYYVIIFLFFCVFYFILSPQFYYAANELDLIQQNSMMVSLCIAKAIIIPTPVFSASSMYFVI